MLGSPAVGADGLLRNQSTRVRACKAGERRDQLKRAGGLQIQSPQGKRLVCPLNQQFWYFLLLDTSILSQADVTINIVDLGLAMTNLFFKAAFQVFSGRRKLIF